MLGEATKDDATLVVNHRAAPQPATLVIFGGAGDLSHRKLLPALYNLHVDDLLPKGAAVVGVGRKDFSDDQFREFARTGVEQFSRRGIDQAKWESFADSLFFTNLSLDSPEGLASLGSRLDLIEHQRGLTGNRIYYLAIPPSLFETTVNQLARSRFVGPAGQGPFARLIVEKPI